MDFVRGKPEVCVPLGLEGKMPEVAMLSGQVASVNVVSFVDERSQLLEALESHLVAQVSEMVHQYAWLFHPETIDLALHDIAQEVRVRFWEVAASREIRYPKAYLSRMVHNTVVDLARMYEATLPLPLDAHGELYQGHMIIVASENLQDPSQQLLQEESEQANIKLLVDFIFRLPRRQREAMLCLLKPMMEEVYVFEQILKQAVEAYNKKIMETANEQTAEAHDEKTARAHNKIDIEKIGWPKDARQNRRLRSSLIIARKKLAKYLAESVNDLGTITSLTGMQAYARQVRDEQAEQQREREKRSRLKRQSKKRQEQRAEQRLQLVEAFKCRGAQLPERYRMVLQLHYVEKRSFSEIAEQLQVPKGTVKACVHRGVQLLRQETPSPLSGQSGNQNGDLEALRAILAARCHELAEPYQTTVRLHCIEHQAYPEIARTLGVSVNTVKSRLSRARKLLQRI